MEQGAKLEYMSWSILLCPFTPFIVLFRNVITDLNLEDLRLLEEFISSIDWLKDKTQREPLQRFQQLCEAFYNLAKHFVAARSREDAASQSTQATLAGMNQVGIDLIQDPNTFDGQMDDPTLSMNFQEWLNNHMDFLSDDWLALGTL